MYRNYTRDAPNFWIPGVQVRVNSQDEKHTRAREGTNEIPAKG